MYRINKLLIARYGEGSRIHFAALARVVKSENASRCYVSIVDDKYISGVRMPGIARFESDNINYLQESIYEYFKDATNNIDTESILLIGDKPREGDMPLYVEYNDRYEYKGRMI